MKKLLALLVAVAFLVEPVQATWSIVILNTRTREVAVGSATCITNTDLKLMVPLVLVGEGAAAAQAGVSSVASNRRRIWTASSGVQR